MRLSQFQTIFVELYPLISAITAMIVAQILKFTYNYMSNGELKIRQLGQAGGMPSSHAALVTSLAAAIGLDQGWTSPLFSICVVFAMIVLYDAAGVRAAAGKQAVVLNQMMEDLFEHGKFQTEKLTELLGHSPLEVIVGACLGIGIAFTLYY